MGSGDENGGRLSQTEVCFPRGPHKANLDLTFLANAVKMAVSVEVAFVDESDFLKEGKGYFLIANSRWEKSSTISLDSNDSLADVSDFSEETLDLTHCLRCKGFRYNT